jgi:parallel beta-helix repeat protein
VQHSVLAENQYGLNLNSASPTLTGNTVQGNTSNGVYISGNSAPVLTGNTITGSNIGINVQGTGTAATSPRPVVTGNSIFNNASYNFNTYNYGANNTVTLDATGNWWGTVDVAAIAAKIYDRTETTGSPVVAFGPYLDGAGGAPVAGDYLNGVLDSSTVLVSGTSYTVTGALVVPVGQTLTVPAGVAFRFALDVQLEVRGTLLVQGTSGSVVVFSSSAATPAMGDWAGIWVYSGGSVDIAYADIRHGSYGVYFQSGSGGSVQHSVLAENQYGLNLNSASPTLTGNTVQGNTSNGVYISGNSAPVLTGNTITGSNIGINVQGTGTAATSPRPVVTGNSIFNNASYNFNTYNYGANNTVTLDATGNWWGTVDVAAIAAKIYDRTETTGSPVVAFGPYLDGAGGAPVAGDYLNGVLDSSTVLVSGTSYTVTGALVVPVGQTLTVPAGVAFRFALDVQLEVRGTLLVQGTSGSVVVFSSSAATPAMGDWAGIWVYSGGSVDIAYADIRHGSYGVYFQSGSGGSVQHSVLAENQYGLNLNSASPTLTGNTVQGNTSNGVYISGNSAPVLTGNTITGSNIGINVQGTGTAATSPRPVVTGNSIFNNASYNFNTYNYGANNTVTLDATGNWWGTVDVAAIAAKIYDRTETTGSPVVAFGPYLDGAGGAPVAGDYLNGVLDSSTVLVSGTSYTVTGALVVPVGQTLTVPAGVAFRFALDVQLEVRGTLLVQGTSGSVVVFSSSAATPAMGDWAGIWVYSGGSVDIAYADIRHGSYGVYFQSGSGGSVQHSVLAENQYGLNLNSASPTLTGNTVQGNTSNGVYISGNSAPVLTGNTITGSNIGINVQGTGTAATSPRPVVTGNSIFNNASYNFNTYNYGANNTVTLDATGNWWGTVDVAAIAAKIYDRTETTGSPVVAFGPYLDGAGGAPVAGDYLNGVLDSSTVLVSGTSYTVTGALVVPVGQTLTVPAGVAFRFALDVQLEVRGTLLVQGTSGSVVVFSSSAATPAMGDWAGIWVYSGGSVDIAYADIRHGSYGVYFQSGSGGSVQHSVLAENQYGLNLNSASPTLTGNTVQGNTSNGVYISGNSAPVLTGNTITGSNIGINVQGTGTAATSPRPVVTGNSIFNNASYNFNTYNYGANNTVTLDATGNWWGTVDVAAIAAKIYDRTETTGSPVVAFGPYLDGAGGAPVAGDYLNGVLDSSTVLVSGTSYTVTGALVVPVGQTLTVPAGVAFRFALDVQLEVRGTLLVQGTSGSVVVFSSSAATPAMGDWAGIWVYSGGSVDIAYADIRHGSYGVYFQSGSGGSVQHSVLAENQYGLYLNSASPTLSDNTLLGNSSVGIYIQNGSPAVTGNTILGNNSYGVYISGNSAPAVSGNTIQNGYIGVYIRDNSAPTLTGNTITGNSYAGVDLAGTGNAATSPRPVVTGNSIFGNGSYNFVAQGYGNGNTVTLDATGNWWGTVDVAAIATKIYDRTESSGSPIVDYSGWLNLSDVPLQPSTR